MAVPAIVRAFRPTTLQVLCAVGFFHGISMFAYTIRQRRRLTRAQQTNQDRDLLAKQSTPPDASPLHVIQLSPKTGTVRLPNLTQQQKIAAALIRAGSSNSPSWYDADLYDSESQSSVQVITAPPTTASEDAGNDPTQPHRDIPTQPRWKINMMFSVSATLTILSIYFFLKSLR